MNRISEKTTQDVITLGKLQARKRKQQQQEAHQAAANAGRFSFGQSMNEWRPSFIVVLRLSGCLRVIHSFIHRRASSQWLLWTKLRD